MTSFAARKGVFLPNSVAALLLLTGGLLSGLRAQPLMPYGTAGNPPPPRMPAQAMALRPDTDVVTPAPAALSVTLTDRQQARAFYNAIFNLYNNVPSGWTGSLSGTPGEAATGTSGTTTAAFQAGVQLSINWFRAMAGLPADVAFDSDEGAQDQDAALMMAANGQLSHAPPSDWLLYTSDGATAAANSNLALGNYGPDAISLGYMLDYGFNNTEVGHRRWILYPQTQTMATGDIPPTDGFSSANATWILDSNRTGPRPATRDGFVAWPPPGYVPYQVVYPRWSFSYAQDDGEGQPEYVDFTNATVTMTSNGNPVAVQLEPLDNGAGGNLTFGENTIVWDYNGLDGDTVDTPAPQPSSDTLYQVTVSNVVVNGITMSPYVYTVTVFDPAVPGPGELAPAVSGPTAPTVGQSATYTVANIPSFAGSFSYQAVALSPLSTVYGAEGGLQGVIADTSAGYNPVDTSRAASGSASYHLATPDFSTQTLILPGSYAVPQTPASASLIFWSELGFATTAQTAHVQVSTDGGNSWTDIYAQTGVTGTAESVFTPHAISLSAYAGETIMVDFSYTTATGGSAYNETSGGVGWNIDNIALTGVEVAAVGATSAARTGSTFAFTPASTGPVGLQAAAVLFNTYSVSWGPMLVVNPGPASSAPVIVTPPVSQNLIAGAGAYLTVAASGPGTFTYQWYFNGSPLSDGGGVYGSASSMLVLTDTVVANSGAYTCTVTNAPGSSATSAAATLSVSSAGTEVFEAQPSSATLAAGQTASFVAVASHGQGVTGSLTYQWNLNGVPLSDGNGIIGATDPYLVVSGISASSAGTYNCLVTDLSGEELSLSAVLTLSSSADLGRLTNVSVRTNCGTGSANIIAGFVIGGSGANSTSKEMLIRADGPELGTLFSVPGSLPDPSLDVFNTSDSPSVSVGQNTGWCVTTTNENNVVAAGSLVYAFPLTTNSASSATVLSLTPDQYTENVTGASGDTGIALAEIYDVTNTTNSYSPVTPRLINVSARANVATGAGNLIAGFTIGGSTDKTVLVRGTGPGLAEFSLTGLLDQPTLSVYGTSSGSSVSMANNTGWGDDPTLAAVANSVYAFTQTSSADCALLVTLPPGTYTANLDSNDGTSGLALVEVYEVP